MGSPVALVRAPMRVLVVPIVYPYSGLGRRRLGKGVGRCWLDLGGNGLHRF